MFPFPDTLGQRLVLRGPGQPHLHGFAGYSPCCSSGEWRRRWSWIPVPFSGWSWTQMALQFWNFRSGSAPITCLGIVLMWLSAVALTSVFCCALPQGLCGCPAPVEALFSGPKAFRDGFWNGGRGSNVYSSHILHAYRVSPTRTLPRLPLVLSGGATRASPGPTWGALAGVAEECCIRTWGVEIRQYWAVSLEASQVPWAPLLSHSAIEALALWASDRTGSLKDLWNASESFFHHLLNSKWSPSSILISLSNACSDHTLGILFQAGFYNLAQAENSPTL